MGTRGPAPTPTPILEARGSWRAKMREGEPQLPVETPDCPDWLGDEAKAEWKRQVKHLEAMGVIAKADRALLAAYCEAWGEFVALVELIAAQGYEGEGVWRLTIAKNSAADRLLRLAQQFGFSPAARTRLRQIDPKKEGGKGGKARFFRAS